MARHADVRKKHGKTAECGMSHRAYPALYDVAEFAGVLTAVAPIDGTPADRVGIKSGDQILRIDGQPTKNMSLVESMKKMRGPKGSKVTLSIHRAQWRGTRDFTMVRAEIPLFLVRASQLAPGYGYIRISNFQDSTTDDTLTALDKLRAQQPIKGLVLDLRNNPGGLLEQAVRVPGAMTTSQAPWSPSTKE